MKLKETPFRHVAQGKKTIEMRLFDEKRSKLGVGDEIEFSLYSDSNKTIKVKVVKLYKYSNFAELYKNFDKVALGYRKNELSDPKDMEKYYSALEQSKYGVLAIELKLI